MATDATLCTPGGCSARVPGYYIAVEPPHPLAHWSTGIPGTVVLAAHGMPPQADVASRVLSDLCLNTVPAVSPTRFVAGPFATPHDALDWYAAFEAPTRTAAAAADALAASWEAHDPVIAAYFRWLAEDRRDLPEDPDAGPPGSASS